MASPSTSRWSWKTRGKTTNGSHPPTLLSSSCSTSSSLLYFSIHRRRTSHLTNLSLDQNPSSSSSSDISPATENKVLKKKTKKTTIQNGRSMDAAASSLIGNEKLPSATNISVIPGKLKNQSLSARMRSLLGKRNLWRRIFFASKKVRSILLLNLLALVYASNIPVIKVVEAVMDPAAFTVVRFASSAIPFIPFVIKARGDVQTRAAGLELGIWVSLGYLMQALGLVTSDAGRASFISLFTVIMVPLMDGLLGATIPARTWFGALMSVLGVTLLETSGSPPAVGDLFNFLSAVFFGVHMLRTEHISRTTKRENFLALLGYEVCVVAAFSTIWYLVGVFSGSVCGFDPGSWTWITAWGWIVGFPWIPALYTGFFSTGLCLWVEMTAMRDVSATETAIIYGLEPLWGAGFAWFLLGERWGTSGWIGAALVLGGSLTVQIFGATSPSVHSEEESFEQGDLLISDKRNGLSASPVVVSSRKHIQDIIEKK